MAQQLVTRIWQPAPSMRQTVRGWLPLVVLPTISILLIPSDWPRWALMWMLAGSIYTGCKWLTWRRTRATAPLWRHLGYLFAWPGLDAHAFLTRRSIYSPQRDDWALAFANCVIGVALIAWAAQSAPFADAYVIGWTGMIGLVLLLHFGVFHLLSCLWRSTGVEARPLMDHPLHSVSLAEFWGRRWNSAFRDLTHRFVFGPLRQSLGAPTAILCGFVFSGLLHELVISLPAQGGYGGPTLFFTMQGVALLVERSAPGRQFGLGHGFRGWAFTMCVLVAPLYWLFHRPFVETIVVPFVRAMGFQ